MSPISLRLKDNVYITGISLIALSLIIFLIPTFSNSATDETMGFFAINFLLSVLYFIVGIASGRFRKGTGRLHLIFLFLILALISAYSLNREMSVFQQSTTWMCIVLVGCCVNYIGFALFAAAPIILKHIMCCVLGLATVLFVYLSAYLLPLYGVGFAAFLVLGISLHTFIPLLFTIYTIVLLRRVVITFPKGLYSYFTGIILVLAFALIFILKWNSTVSTINNEYRKQLVDGDGNLPAWIRVAQRIEAGPITERILKAGLSYAVPAEDVSFLRMPERNFGEEQKHDPLVMMSSMTTERVQLSKEERINILKSLYDSRHQAEERLWSGENLVTTHVDTRLKLWPALRIVYTEKIISVTNKNTKGWGRSEEAIYTFHLPEGGVVTSLSLWINGKEEKAILTSKEKAANAYTTIVGVEQRDPSVIHWQEGNRVSVRVFPVLAGETRPFKVGITSPTTLNTGDIVYDNIWFDGPSFASAKEEIKADLVNASGVLVPASFNKTGDNHFERSGKYNPDWNLSCTAQPIVQDAFSFDDHVYSVLPNVIERQSAVLSKIYLDINSSWTEDDFASVWELVKDREVLAYRDGEIERITEKNRNDMFAALGKERFSIFPFYKIKEPTRSLVVSKSVEMSPNLDELSESTFLNKLENKFDPANRYRLFNLSSTISPYLASLREKRYFHYEAGSTKLLQQLLQENKFVALSENDEEVIIHSAGIKLVKKPGTLEQSAAPDHLMRLFNYNHIMQQLGEHPMHDEAFTEKLTEVARQSYIVTPLFSLVVLESQKDYDRFDIKQKDNSLQNASMKSTGAVPEPHERALIILAIVALLCARFPYLLKFFVWKA